MDRESFEQLLSEWLDEPTRADLRAAIEAATAESPPLGGVRDEWLRLDALTRVSELNDDDVEWSQFRKRIDRALSREPRSERLEVRLRHLTDVERRVDWSRFRERVSGAATARDRQIRRRRRVRLATGIAILTAAAALVFMFAPRKNPPSAPAGIARVRVSAPGDASAPTRSGRAYARVSVSAPPDADDAAAGPGSSRAQTDAPRLVEVFLMLGPVRVTDESRTRLAPFGFN